MYDGIKKDRPGILPIGFQRGFAKPHRAGRPLWCGEAPWAFSAPGLVISQVQEIPELLQHLTPMPKCQLPNTKPRLSPCPPPLRTLQQAQECQDGRNRVADCESRAALTQAAALVLSFASWEWAAPASQRSTGSGRHCTVTVMGPLGLFFTSVFRVLPGLRPYS